MAYFTMAAFRPDMVSRYAGRKSENVAALRGFWFDIDVGAGHKNAPYSTGDEAQQAVKEFTRGAGLLANFVVSTGSGGLHLHFLLSENITRAEWAPRARALVALAEKHGLKIDTQVTTDAARIMRAPGSRHQNGSPVVAFQSGKAPYGLAEFDALIGYEPSEASTSAPTYDLSVNRDVSGDYPLFSYLQAGRQCGAMTLAAQDRGAGTPYAPWLLAARAAALSVEGREFAHEISCGHPDYDEAETDRKIGSLTGGPASCEAWDAAWGADSPCRRCPLWGKIKNPAVELGRVVDTSPPGADENPQTAPDSTTDAPDWVREFNQRFALVRHGSKMVVADFQSPAASPQGVSYGLGFLEPAALRAMFNGRYVEAAKLGEKPRPLVAAWLAHPKRRQYSGQVFNPGENTPPGILNLWRGFDVQPAPGDVTPWQQALDALVPDPHDRAFVLNWLAWKVQKPGGVPDTVLIFTGAKGTGKNSLLDPLLTAFGRHAMLADDPELIAGRFTWHLYDKCLAVLDEAVFIQDPRQSDRIKSRVTAKTMLYEQKGMDPVPGVNRCAYVMLTNHSHAWQATTDERRAVVIEAGEARRGDLEFWRGFHDWADTTGPAALLHHLQNVNLAGFDPRRIPKGAALRRQIEQTALRDPAVAWWHQCMAEGAIRWRETVERVEHLNEDEATEVRRSALRQAWEQSTPGRKRNAPGWAMVSKRLRDWVGPDGIRSKRPRNGPGELRDRVEILPPLHKMRAAFEAATGVKTDD